MLELPKNIDEKIQKLPVISFGDSEAFQQVLFSDDFTDIFNYYRLNYLPDVLKSKPEIEQKISLYLSLTNQDESFVEQTDQILYRRPIPDIHTFLSDNFYMGYNNATLYNYWREKLELMFTKGSPVRKAIFQGCIGSGKSTVARKAFIYVLYRALCLRYPRATFNIDTDSTIANVVISMTLKQVYETNMLPFVKLMESMPCFQRVQSVRAFENFDLTNPKCPIPFQLEKSTATVFFPDNIILTCGSNAGHFTGMNVINSFCDEMNEKSVDEALALLNTLDNRFASRFSGSDLVFQSVVSSARTTNSPVGEYVKKLPKNDPAIISFSPCLWEVKPDPNFIGDGTTFPVLVGNGSIPSRIITNPGELEAIEKGDFYIPAGCLKIDVPTVYRSKFELQLDQSIQDIAGISTYDNSMLFRDTSQLEDPLLVPELTIEANLKENTNIFDCLPINQLFVKDSLKDEYRLKRYPAALRYMHFDLSSTGECDTGICMMHKEYKINEITREKETIYVTDFIIYVTAKNMTDLEAVQNFAMELVTRGHVPIHTISCDQFQCFTGDTKISLLNGKEMPIKEIVERVNNKEDLYTYTYDIEKQRIVPGKIISGLCTGNKEIYEIVLDNNEIIKCTGNHRFMLRNGTYKEAKDLKNGEALMPLYRKVNKKGYELTTNPMSGKDNFTYRRIAEYQFDEIPKNYHVHHIDFNKNNNNPTNLKLLSKEDHFKLHWSYAHDRWQNPEFRNTQIERMQKVWKNYTPEQRAQRSKKLSISTKNRYLKDPIKFTQKSIEATKLSFDANDGKRRKEQAERIKKINQTNPPRLNSKTSKEAIENFKNSNKKTWQKPGYKEKMKNRYPGSCAYLTGKYGKNYKQILSKEELNKEKVNAKIEWLKKRGLYKNHKIISITKTNRIEPVYDITIDNFPNFALSAGVFVHNSQITLNTWEQSKLFDKVEKVSVDVKLDPYLNAATLIENGKVKVGQCEKLRKELEALVIDKGKVTRTTQLKDGADVLVGSIFNAQMNYNDIPQNEYYTELPINKEIDYTTLIDTEQEELIDL